MDMRTDLKAAQEVVELITGGWRAQCLYTAVKLDIPTLVEAGHRTDEELAEVTGSEIDGVHRLMRLLVALRVFEGDGETGYRNTAVSELLKVAPNSLRDMCLLYGEEFYTAWAFAKESITTVTAGFEFAFGEPLYQHLGNNPGLSERFQLAMKAGNLFFDHVPDAIDVAGKTFVDVGAGPGQLTAAILGAVPDARAKVMDRPHVIEVARENLAASVGLDRVELVGGDMVDEVPSGGDVYFLCRVLAGWSDEAVVRVFENCGKAMAGPDSRLVILDRVVDDENPTMLPSLWDLHLLMTNGGRHRSLADYVTLLDRAGFTVERVAELPAETTAIVAAR